MGLKNDRTNRRRIRKRKHKEITNEYELITPPKDPYMDPPNYDEIIDQKLNERKELKKTTKKIYCLSCGKKLDPSSDECRWSYYINIGRSYLCVRCLNQIGYSNNASYDELTTIEILEKQQLKEQQLKEESQNKNTCIFNKGFIFRVCSILLLGVCVYGLLWFFIHLYQTTGSEKIIETTALVINIQKINDSTKNMVNMTYIYNITNDILNKSMYYTDENNISIPYNAIDSQSITDISKYGKNVTIYYNIESPYKTYLEYSVPKIVDNVGYFILIMLWALFSTWGYLVSIYFIFTIKTQDCYKTQDE